MKTAFKRLCLLAMLLLAMLLLSGCGGPESTYKKAQDLLAKGKYTEAGEEFESIGSYEDASTLAMYCKACALCESGSYEEGIAALKSLGDYKDCTYRITYYTARSWDDGADTTDFESMQKAKSIYSENPLFLDSGERITALDKRIAAAKKTLYNDAVKKAEKGEYNTAITTFRRLGSYSDSAKRITYYGIRADEDALATSVNQDDVLAIAVRYIHMGAFLDCADRASAMTEKADKIATEKYAKVAALVNEGKCTEAETVLTSFGQHGNEQVPENYYAIGEKYLTQSEWDAAAAAFRKAGEYSDAMDCIIYCDIRKAEAALGDATDMATIKAVADRYNKLGTVQDSAERVAALEGRVTGILDGKYDAAVALMKAGKYEAALTAFTEIYTYKDSAEQIKACRTAILDSKYDAAVALKEAEKYEAAIAAFTKIETHKDSKAQIAACKTAILDRKYDAAMALKNAGKYEEAVAAFIALNGYKNSEDNIVACKFMYAEELCASERYSEAKLLFESIPNYRNSAEWITECDYQIACAYQLAGQYAQAAIAFSDIGNYKDSAARLTQNQYHNALELMANGEYEAAIVILDIISGYSDSNDIRSECKYLLAKEFIDRGYYNKARETFAQINKYKDSGAYIALLDDAICVVLGGTSEYDSYDTQYIWVTNEIDTATCTSKYVYWHAESWGKNLSVRYVSTGIHCKEWKRENQKITMTKNGEKPSLSPNTYYIWEVASNWTSVYQRSYTCDGTRIGEKYDTYYKEVDVNTARQITESYVSCYEEQYNIREENKYYNIFLSVFVE